MEEPSKFSFNKFKKFKNLSRKKIIIIAYLSVALFLLVSTFAVKYYVDHIFTVVCVDGCEMGFVKDYPKVEEFLSELTYRVGQAYGLEAELIEEVTFTEGYRPKEKDNWEDLQKLLSQQLQFKFAAEMILVNGRETVVIECSNDLERVKELLKEPYRPTEKNVELKQIEIQEKLETTPYQALSRDICKPEEAAEFFLKGADQGNRIYLASRSKSYPDMWSNLEVDNYVAEEGALINVCTIEEIKEKEKIEFETQYKDDKNMYTGEEKIETEGEEGERENTYRLLKINGEKIKQEKVKEEIIREPVDKVILKGTKERSTVSAPISHVSHTVTPPSGSGNFIWPLASGGRITSGFGWRSGRLHAGVDIVTSTGTPIRAADGGRVVHSGWENGYGYSVVIDHGNRYFTRYAHNSKNLVSTGQQVNKGSQIALVGSTGRSTSPHLHFEVRVGGMYGQAINPMQFY